MVNKPLLGMAGLFLAAGVSLTGCQNTGASRPYGSTSTPAMAQNRSGNPSGTPVTYGNPSPTSGLQKPGSSSMPMSGMQPTYQSGGVPVYGTPSAMPPGAYPGGAGQPVNGMGTSNVPAPVYPAGSGTSSNRMPNVDPYAPPSMPGQESLPRPNTTQQNLYPGTNAPGGLPTPPASSLPPLSGSGIPR